MRYLIVLLLCAPMWAQYTPPSNGGSSYKAVTDGSPIAWNLGGAFVGNGSVTLSHTTATRVLNVSNLASGGFYTLIVKQDATGGAALTGGTGCTWLAPGGSSTGAFTIATTANAINVVAFTYDGTNCLVVPSNAYLAM